MHGIWRQATSDMTLEQVNHHERPGVLPIAFSLVHQARLEDASTNGLLIGRPPIWQAGGWAARIGVTVDDMGKDTTVAEAELLRLGDLDAFCAYQDAVFTNTDRWLAEQSTEGLTAVMFGGEVPDFLRRAFIARVVEDGPITALDGVECWVFQHGIRHLGEVEHARALVGLGGFTS
jgi:hypothetical protein